MIFEMRHVTQQYIVSYPHLAPFEISVASISSLINNIGEIDCDRETIIKAEKLRRIHLQGDSTTSMDTRSDLMRFD